MIEEHSGSLHCPCVRHHTKKQKMSTATKDNFVVLPASSAEDFDFVKAMCIEEQWYWIGGPSIAHLGYSKPGFFIGYLNGQRIGHVGVFKHGDDNESFYYIGLYIVDKPFRGKGYGLKIWNVMWESLPKDSNIALDGLLEKVPLYERMGFRPEGLSVEYTLSCSKVVDSFRKVNESLKISLEIKLINEVPFGKLLEYDTSVFGFVRSDFLQKWITIPQCLAWVATNKTGEIVGYVVIHDSIAEKHQIVGPLFSDDLQIGRALLFKAAEEAIKQQSAEKLRIWVGSSPEVTKMIESEIGYDSILETMRMYTKGVPANFCMKKIIAITSPVYG